MLYVRPATLRDALRMLEWRNEPAAVFNSTTQRIIPILSHLEWYQAALVDPARRFFVAMESNNTQLGYGRLKGVAPGADIELTICIDVAHRSFGYGTALVACLCEEAEKHGGARAWAYIKATNIGSVRAFLRNGFTIDNDQLPWVTVRRSLVDGPPYGPKTTLGSN